MFGFVKRKELNRLEERLKKLEVQLSESVEESNNFGYLSFFEDYRYPTIKGKIEAIAKHLGIAFSIESGTKPRTVVINSNGEIEAPTIGEAISFKGKKTSTKKKGNK